MSEKNKDFFRETTEEGLKKAGYESGAEVSEEVRVLHQKLEEMGKTGRGYLDLEAPVALVEEPATETLEQKEKREKFERVATNLLDCFNFNPGKESFLVITDDKVIAENGVLVEALRSQLEQITSKDPRTKGNFEIIVVPASPKSATPFGKEIGEKIKSRPVLIITSMSRSHSSETGAAIRGEISSREEYAKILRSPDLRRLAESGFSGFSLKFFEEMAEHDGSLPQGFYEKLKRHAAKNKIRLISITKGHNPYEILTKGAVEESTDILRERGDKVDKLLKDVQKVRIASPAGTDLVMEIRPDKTEIEDARVDKPGKLANYPLGEWSCSPFLEHASGILVADGPIGGNHNLDMVKKFGPLKYRIENGVIVEINDLPIDQDTGNELAESVKNYLRTGGPHGFRLAEFGVGTNGKACEGKPDEWVGSSEGEKKYGTIHIAFGSNGTFGVEKTDPNFNDCSIHCDNVIGWQSEVTVECTKKDGITFNFIEAGRPRGY